MYLPKSEGHGYDGFHPLHGKPAAHHRLRYEQAWKPAAGSSRRKSWDLGKRLIFEAALSFNKYQYHYQNSFPTAETERHQVNFSPQLLPRVALSYKINPMLVWRASVSKGYSPPTLAEVRPSNNSVYNGLQPEGGWNYETGFRLQSVSQRIQADVPFPVDVFSELILPF